MKKIEPDAGNLPHSRTTNPQAPRARVCLVATLALAAGIYAVQAQPPAPPAATITLEPGVDKGYAVGGRDDGLGITNGGYAWYFFGDTMLTRTNSNGQTWVVNTMYHTTNFNGATGITNGYNWWLNGYPPNQFIPYTPDETNWNATNAHGYAYGIWPVGQFYSPGDSNHYITVSKVIEESGGATVGIGTGFAICPTNPINGNMTRVDSRPGNAQPYLLWDESQGEWGDMCVTMGNYVYAYWVAGTNWGYLYVARASLLGSPPAFLAATNWQYWNGSAWATNSPSSAAYLFSGAGIGTIDWNAFLTNGAGGNGVYLYTYDSWVSTQICCRASSDLVHWSAATVEYDVPGVPSGDYTYFGRAQKNLEQKNGRTVFVSYCMPCTNIPNQNINMIQLQFP